MDSIFSVDEEINFSDDDIDFNKSKDKPEYSIIEEDIPDTVPVSLNDSNKSLLRNEIPCNSRDMFKLRRNSNNSCDFKGKTFKSMVSHSSTHKEKQSDDIIFNNFLNDDTDDLLSQIDMPMNENDNCISKQTDTKQKSKHNPVERLTEKKQMNSINNHINSTKEYSQRKESLQSSRNHVNVERRYPGICSKETFNNTERNSPQNITTKLPTPFCNKRLDGDMFIPPCQTVRSHEDVTPIKHVSEPVVLNKRKLSDSHEKTSVKPSSSKQRRFPGPAGLLPSINNFSCLEKLKSPEQCKAKGKRTLTPLTPKTTIQSIFSCSQDDDFNQAIWTDVQKQVYMLFPRTNCEIISKILEKATMNQLNNGKVALLCGLIKSFSISGSGGQLVLKDPSGEINGTVHKNVLNEYESDLSQGSGLILKDISVFSPTLKKHYINITPSNIVQIFPAEINDIMPTQLQSTQLPQNNAGNVIQRIRVEKENMFEGNVIPKDPGNTLNDKSSDIFGNEDLDQFFSDDLCGF